MNTEIRLFSLEEKCRNDIDKLLFQLSGKRRIANLENHPNSHFIGAFCEDKLVGFVQVIIIHKCAFTYGLLEDVVVDEEYRGQGIGTKLVVETINFSKTKGANRINLTSRAERGEARRLFESLGFIKQDTEVLRLEFK